MAFTARAAKKQTLRGIESMQVHENFYLGKNNFYTTRLTFSRLMTYIFIYVVPHR
jgi:hypothetical protein